MSGLTLHGIANCDTVKKARAWLEAHGVAYDFRDYNKTPPTGAELAEWADALGWETLLNRAGTTFRKLPPEEREPLDRERAIDLMLASPSMIKRPLVTGIEPQLIGFKPDQWAAVLA